MVSSEVRITVPDSDGLLLGNDRIEYCFRMSKVRELTFGNQ
jgi:hypothetical protein